MSISVLGAGSWGSALAIMMSHVSAVTLWSRNYDQVLCINKKRINSQYLDDILFPANITATTDFGDALNSELIIIALPTSALRNVMLQISQEGKRAIIPDIIWACKGFELNSGLLPHQIVHEVCPQLSNVGALLGPSFAKEAALGLPTAVSLVSNDLLFIAKWIQHLKAIPNFRIYANCDVIGSEVGAAVKNIMAIAVGIADGLNLGNNARSALITRSLNELGLLIIKLGGCFETVYGLTGVGDLILTCTGDLSRNRNVGLQLAKGYKIDAILAQLGHVAEGVNAALEVYKMSINLGLEMPIINTVYRIIYENANIVDSVNSL
ncbi:MAG: NAD(P)-dependent glycerol-3-phosphate dehydrogenase, partial [Burkholderiales bacterium]|nr:NAD(P)-dependent glycerol-3-phosphate dehydrogenase [Burkholderiales bacterium]